jgi:hypothetical protein
MFCPKQKINNLLDFQNQRYIGIFISLRKRERERARAREGEKERERKRKRKREKESAGNYIFKPPWQK